jgi:hypothetical protein
MGVSALKHLTLTIGGHGLRSTAAIPALAYSPLRQMLLATMLRH